MGTQTPTADSSKTASTPRIALKAMIVSLLLGSVDDDASSAKLYKPFCGKCFYIVEFNMHIAHSRARKGTQFTYIDLGLCSGYMLLLLIVLTKCTSD